MAAGVTTRRAKGAVVPRAAPRAQRASRSERDAEIVKRLKARDGAEAVAEAFGLTRERVRTIWRLAGNETPLPRPLTRDAAPKNRAFLAEQQAKRDAATRTLDEEIEAMTALVKAGFSVRKAGLILGIPETRSARLGISHGLHKLSRFRKNRPPGFRKKKPVLNPA